MMIWQRESQRGMKWIDVSTIMLCIYHTYVTTHHFNPRLHYYHILNEDFENMYRLELGESCPVFVYLFVYFFFYNFFFFTSSSGLVVHRSTALITKPGENKRIQTCQNWYMKEARYLSHSSHHSFKISLPSNIQYFDSYEFLRGLACHLQVIRIGHIQLVDYWLFCCFFFSSFIHIRPCLANGHLGPFFFLCVISSLASLVAISG